MTELYINWAKLKQEASNSVSVIKSTKKRSRDLRRTISLGLQGVARDNAVRDFKRAEAEHNSASLRFTRICVLRGLCTGKQHLSPNTKVQELGLDGLNHDELISWVKPELKEFEVK